MGRKAGIGEGKEGGEDVASQTEETFLSAISGLFSPLTSYRRPLTFGLVVLPC
jgi:hypothetical protein